MSGDTFNVGLLAWRLAATLAEPGAALLLRRRLARGKEIAARLPERRGLAAGPRPPGRLVWVHAASVGEALSVLPVLAAHARLPGAGTVLLTTGTATATVLAGERLAALGLGEAVRQAMVPLDVPRWVARFLGHWRPDAAVFVESELWPNMLAACRRRGIPTALLNARMSARSEAGWRRAPRLARALLGGFAEIWARSADDAARLASLGAPDATTVGDLKSAAGALPFDADALAALRRAVGARPCWLAASTHDGEEAVLRDAHLRLRAEAPDALLVVAPRHPARGAAVAALLDDAPRRSLGALPDPDHPFHVADTLGELGVLYRLAPVVFVGRSLAGQAGGQNPLEPARLGCAIATGPATANFAEAVGRLRDADALALVHDAASLAAWAARMLTDDAARAAAGARAEAAAAAASDLPARAARMIAALGR